MDYYPFSSGLGVDALIEGPIRQLIEAGFTLTLCVDGDLRLQKKLKKIPGVEIAFDMAHMRKNVQGQVRSLLQAADYHGDGMDKTGNFNFLVLCKGIKTAQMDCAHGTLEKGWTEEDVIKRMSASVDHHAGELFYIYD